MAGWGDLRSEARRLDGIIDRPAPSPRDIATRAAVGLSDTPAIDTINSGLSGIAQVATSAPTRWGDLRERAAAMDAAGPATLSQPQLANPGVMPGQVANPYAGKPIGSELMDDLRQFPAGVLDTGGRMLAGGIRLAADLPADLMESLGGGMAVAQVGEGMTPEQALAPNQFGGAMIAGADWMRRSAYARTLREQADMIDAGMDLGNQQGNMLAPSPNLDASRLAQANGAMLPTNAAGYLRAGGDVTATLAPAVAAGLVAGPATGLAVGGLAAGGVSASGAYAQAQQAGLNEQASTDQAMSAGLDAGAIAAATSKLPLEEILAAAKRGNGKAIQILNALRSAAAEGGQEAVEEVGTSVAEGLRTDDVRGATAGLGQRVGQSAVMGAIAGGGASGVVGGLSAIGNRGGPQGPSGGPSGGPSQAPPAPNVGGGGVNTDETDNADAEPTIETYDDVANAISEMLATQDPSLDVPFRNRQTKPPAPQVDTVAAETIQPSGNSGQLGQLVSNPDVLEGGTNEGQARQAVGLQGGESQGDIGSPAITQTPRTAVAVDEGQGNVQAPALGATRGETAMAQPLGPTANVQSGQTAARPSTTSTGQSADLDNDGGPIASASTPPAGTEMRGLPASEPERVSPNVPQAAGVPDGRVTASRRGEEQQENVNNKPSSWMVIDKETGEPVAELFDKRQVDRLRTEKYQAIPIRDWQAEKQRRIEAKKTPEEVRAGGQKMGESKAAFAARIEEAAQRQKQGSASAPVSADPVDADIARIAKAVGGKVSRVAAASKGEKAIERRMKDFATDVVYVDDESGKFDGVAIVRDGRRTVYLRKGMDNKQLASVTLHEFGHVLRRENRELHRELVDAVGANRLEAAGEKYREKLAAQFGEDSAEVRRLDEDADVFEDEAVGQLLQDFASEKSDIAELVMSRPGLITKLKQWLLKVTNKMRSGEANARDSKLADAIVDVLAKAEKRAEETQAQRTGWAKSMAGIRKMVAERATNAGRGGNVFAELENELEGQIKSDDETGGELQSINGFDTSFAGKIPSEVLEQISGDRRLRRALASNQKNGMGEDLVMAIGADRYVAILKSKVYGKQMKNNLDAGIAELLKSRDPDDVVVAKVALAAQDAMESGERYKAPKSFLRIAELEPGDTFTIWGKKTVMGQNELGELVGVGGALDGVPVYEGMQPIPVDGEVRKGKAPAVVSAEQSDSYNWGVETTDDIPFSPRAKLPATINIDGVDRPTTNSKGQQIATTEEGVRNFWKWFGDSKVVDGQGRPLVVYHGTASKIDGPMRPSRGGTHDYGTGIYLSKSSDVGNYYSDRNYSMGFSDNMRDGANVLPVYARVLRPIDEGELPSQVLQAAERISGSEDWKDEVVFSKNGAITLADAAFSDFHQKWHRSIRAAGYDGVIPRASEEQDVVVFDPTQIKSATGNSGAFDGENADIRFAPRDNNKPVNTNTASRSQLAAILKEFDVSAVGSTESLRERAEFLTANPRDWTREQFDKFAYLLKVHQDVNGTHNEETIATIMRDGLRSGMVDSLARVAGVERGYSFGAGLLGNPAYVLAPGGIKWQSKDNPRMASGSRPMFVITPTKGEDVYDAIVRTARMPEAFAPDTSFAPRDKGVGENAIPAGSGRAAKAVAGIMDKAKAATNVARLERAMGRKVQAQAKREAEQAARQSESAANKFAGQASREVARMGRTAMMKDKLLSKEQSKTKVLREELRHNAGILRAEMNRSDRRERRGDEQQARAERAEAKGSEQASLARTARQARAAVYAIAKQLPADVRGKMLAAVRDASTPREVLAAYAKADEVLGAYEVREADTMLRKIGRRKELAFLGPEVRKEVEAGIAKAAQMREELRLLAKATESPETDEQKKGATGRSIASLMGAGGTQARNMADASKATADVSEDANRKQANTLRRKQNEYVDFANTVRERAAGERLQNKLIREQFNASLKDLTEELRATAVARRSPMPPKTIKVLDVMGNKVTKDSKESQKPNVVRRLAMVEASLRTIAIDLDRKVDGVLNRMIDKVQRGSNKASDDVNRANRMIDAAARRAGYKDFRDAAVKIGSAAGEANAKMVTLRMTASDGGESDIAMTMGDAMYLHALMKESDAGKKLREGQTITLQDGKTRYVASDAFAAQVADVIGPEHVALYDAMQRAGQLSTKAAMDVRLAVTGKVPPIIENYVRTSRDGVFRKPGEGNMPTDVGEGSGPVLTNLPMFQERVANTNTPYRLMNYWDAVQSTIQEQATVANVAIPLLAVERTLLSGPAAVAIERRYGDRVRKTVRRYLAATAGAAPVQGKLGRFALEVNRKRSRGLVTNLRNIAMNFGGMARVMGEVQMADWSRGLANVGLKGLDEMLAKSSLARSRMRQRYANIQTQTTGNDASYVTDDMNRPSWVDIGQLRTAIAETARSIRAGNIGDAWGKNINEVADSQRLPQFVDAMTMTHLWGAKRAEGRRKGLRDARLDEYTLREFERSLPNVVPSHDAADISGIRLGTNNGVLALGMTFLSEPTSMWQQAHQAYELRNEPGGKGRMTRVVAGFVANAMWSGLMQIVMRKTTLTTLGTMPLVVLGLMEPGDDDERKQAAEIRERALARISDVIPGVAGSTLAQGGKPGAMNLLRAALGEDQTLIAERSSRVFGSEGGMIWGTANTMYEQFNNLAMAAAQDETEDKLRRAMAAITEIMGEAALSSGLPDDPFDWLASWIRKK